LMEEDLDHIPQEDPNYILDEPYHKAAIKLLSSEGYTSVLLTGDTGYGKTSSVEQIACQMRQPLLRLNMTGSTKVEHLLQEQVVDTKKKEIRWEDRDLLIAWKRGYWLLIDEVSAANPQVIFLFFRVLESFPTLKTFDGKVFKPHPMTKIIFTDNRIGNPNYYKYHGTQAQNLAFISRIASTVVYDCLTPGNERRMLKNRYPSVDTEFIQKLVTFAGDVRTAIADGQFNEFLGTRDLEHIVQNFIAFKDPTMALGYGYLNKLQEKTDKDFIAGLFQRSMGTTIASPI
jgi:midasin (ATPase involved in ribosome maturation)